MPTQLIVKGKPYKGTPAGGTVSVPTSHTKVLVAMGRLAYGTRMMQAAPVVVPIAEPEPAAPVRRGPGRPRKVQPVVVVVGVEPIAAPEVPDAPAPIEDASE